MNNAVGTSALRVALGMAILAIGLAVWGVRRRDDDVVRAAYSAVYANAVLLSLAVAAMLTALLSHDFSVKYVAQVGSRSTPTLYTIASLWGALEGSILFWGWVLSLYAAAVIYVNRHRVGALVPYAAATLMGIAVFFGILLVGPATPFGLVSPIPTDGPGPNPLLQNHILMAVHPPLLYLGYVGMSVPFAFAIGAMLSGELGDDAWISSTRRWTIIAWGFLSAAIIAGMWWSYEVLGWGGYWAWDPVENASFMPWLTATAFLHSVMLQQRRGMLKLWNMCLVVSTFVLTILGTFLTRSGILSSVHAFTQGAIGYYFLAFIAIVLLFSLVLIAGQSGRLRASGNLDAAVSRESVFLLNNLLFAAFTFTVVLGTLFPLVAEALRGVKVSVGAPFFNRMTLPMGMALIFSPASALRFRGSARPAKSSARSSCRPPSHCWSRSCSRLRSAFAIRTRCSPSRSPRSRSSRTAGSFTAARVRACAHKVRPRRWRSYGLSPAIGTATAAMSRTSASSAWSWESLPPPRSRRRARLRSSPAGVSSFAASRCGWIACGGRSRRSDSSWARMSRCSSTAVSSECSRLGRISIPRRSSRCRHRPCAVARTRTSTST